MIRTLRLVVDPAAPALSPPSPAAGRRRRPSRPRRRAPRAKGPFQRLILRGVTVIDGTGAPPMGPADIVIEKNRIVQIVPVGSPGMPDRPRGPPQGRAGGPGDRPLRHVRPARPRSTCTATSAARSRARRPSTSSSSGWATASPPIRDPGSGNGLEWTLEHKAKSAKNEITAPRIEPYVFFGHGPRQAVPDPRRGAQVGRRGGGQGGGRPQVLRLPAGHHAGGDRGGEEARAAQRLPPRADERLAGQRADLGALGPDLDGALVRPARGAVRRPHRPGLSARLQLQRRVAPLRRGRPALEAGRARRAASAGTR